MNNYTRAKLEDKVIEMFSITGKDKFHFRKVFFIFYKELLEMIAEHKIVQINNFIDFRLIPGRIYELVMQSGEKKQVFRKNVHAINLAASLKALINSKIDYDNLIINYKAKKSVRKKKVK